VTCWPDWPRFSSSAEALNDRTIEMPDQRPTTYWAVASLICGVLASLLAVALLALLGKYGEEAARSAGVGIIAAYGHWLLAATFGLLGIILGAVALLKVRMGDYRGRGQAWAGIILGCAPFAFPCVLLAMSDSNPLRHSFGRHACVAVWSPTGTVRGTSWIPTLGC